MDNFGQLQSLCNLYEGDEYMTKRIEYYMTHILPSNLKNEKEQHDRRLERNKTLSEAQQIFIQVFLSKYNYFYLHGCYYQYDGVNYETIKEDDIYHQLLSSISKEKTLMDWKHKTKFIIMKQIREKNLFRCIPETETIQTVLGLLCPAVFHDRETAKYFLTILGDNILKKNGDLIFIVNSDIKKILSSIDSISQITIGQTIMHNFFTKYHATYNPDKCRLLKFNPITAWNDKLSLNMLCVAAYYSANRYGSSENFLLHSSLTLCNYALFLKNTTPSQIVELFCKTSVETATNSSISWIDMHYIWKTYLSSMCMPSIIYSSNLKIMLKSHFTYDEEHDSFLNITSKCLPRIKDFIQFWECTIKETSTGFTMELDELCELFKKWTRDAPHAISSGNMDEQYIAKILSHFFPTVEVIENKYIVGISCSMWDKSADIILSLNHLREMRKDTKTMISIADEAYPNYLKYCRKNKCMNTTKRFFEKYITDSMREFIEFEAFISAKWLI